MMNTVLLGKQLDKVPSVNFVRQCRVVRQHVNNTLVALKLGSNTKWKQLFTDGTSRRQTEFQNLIIGIMNNGVLDPVTVSSCMMLEDRTAEGQVEAILAKVRSMN